MRIFPKEKSKTNSQFPLRNSKENQEMYTFDDYVSHLVNALKNEYPWVKWQTQFISQSIHDLYIYSDVFEDDVEPPDGGHVSGVSFTNARLGKYPITVYGLASSKRFVVKSEKDWKYHFPQILYRYRELAVLKKNVDSLSHPSNPDESNIRDALLNSLTMVSSHLEDLKKKFQELEFERDAIEFNYNRLLEKRAKEVRIHELVTAKKAVPKGTVKKAGPKPPPREASTSEEPEESEEE